MSRRQRGRWKQCSEATVRGDYGSQIQGTRPAPGVPGGPTESVIGVLLRTYDGQGNFSQVSNVKGSISGTVPDSEAFGTYEVHPDCTGIIRFVPFPGSLVEERLVIVDDGREIRAAVMVPTPVVITSVQQRITGARRSRHVRAASSSEICRHRAHFAWGCRRHRWLRRWLEQPQQPNPDADADANQFRQCGW